MRLEVDYRNETEVQRIWKETNEVAPDVVVGSSMGGWFACHLSTVINVPAMLVNPAVVGNVRSIPIVLGGYRPIICAARAVDEIDFRRGRACMDERVWDETR